MTFKIAICDDSAADRQYIGDLVLGWAEQAGHRVHLDFYASGEQFLFHYPEENDYDMLLLDIEMGAMDGVTLAKKLRRRNEIIQIIFITGYARNERVLTFETGGEMVRIPIYQIRSAQVQGNYVTIHASSDVTVKMTLGELEQMLDSRFYRVGRSWIVNLSLIRRVTKTEIQLSDGSRIPLPRGAYEGVNRAIIAHT